MREYPKVPRYEIPIVKDSWFGDNVHLVEKYDGSNFRFGVYDERYQEYYDELDGKHGDWLVGTSSIAHNESEIDEFNDFLKIGSRLDYIKDKASPKDFFELHDNFDSPIIVFAENMIKHTLEYDDDIPPLILFDVYAYVRDNVDERASNPYDEKFSGFLSWEEVEYVANKIQIPKARYIDQGIDREDIEPNMIGNSEYAENKRAEGYVIRNDKLDRRIKVRSPEYLEMHKKIWGDHIDDSDPIEKRIAYKYGTNQRIKKQTIEITKEKGTDMSPKALDLIVSSTVDDIWIEEWFEMTEESFVPFEIYKYIGERVQGTLSRPNLFGIPSETKQITDNWEFNEDSEHIPEPFETSQPNKYIIDMIDKNILEVFSQQILQQDERKPGKWIIEPLTNDIRNWLWTENIDKIKRINVCVDFNNINENLYDVTVPYVVKKYN